MSLSDTLYLFFLFFSGIMAIQGFYAVLYNLLEKDKILKVSTEKEYRISFLWQFLWFIFWSISFFFIYAS